MDDPVLNHVLGQLSERGLRRARESSAKAGDQDLVAKIENRLRDGHSAFPVEVPLS